MSVPLLNSLLLKDEFIQRFGFTSEPPIVAAATVPKFLEILDPPFLILFAPLCYMLDYLRPFPCYLSFCLGLCIFWTVRLCRLYVVSSVKFKVGFSVVVLSGVS